MTLPTAPTVAEVASAMTTTVAPAGVPGPTLDPYFPSTSWTLLTLIRAGATQASAAREQFACRYRRPVLHYFAALTKDRTEAEELTQSFFEKLAASGSVVSGADPSRGRFRHYLKRSLGNHWKSELRFRGRQKRRAEEEVHPDGWEGDGWESLGLKGAGSPESDFHNAWVRSLLEDALNRVRAICETKGQGEHYRLFVGMYLCDASEPPSWRQLGEMFDLPEKAARSRTETVARHFRVVLRELLFEEVGVDRDVDDEIAALLTLM